MKGLLRSNLVCQGDSVGLSIERHKRLMWVLGQENYSCLCPEWLSTLQVMALYAKGQRKVEVRKGERTVACV